MTDALFPRGGSDSKAHHRIVFDEDGETANNVLGSSNVARSGEIVKAKRKVQISRTVLSPRMRCVVLGVSHLTTILSASVTIYFLLYITSQLTPVTHFYLISLRSLHIQPRNPQQPK